jgi:cysteine desulfurase
MRRVYLDHQSATPLSPVVLEAMRPYLAGAFGNAGSLHQLGLHARDALATARAQVAALINAESPDDIIFTSDGTESANLAVKGAAWANKSRGNHIVATATEHPSVIGSIEFLERHGFACTRVPVDSNGFINPGAVKDALTDQTTLICVHHVNHDIGAIEPVAEIGELAAERGITFYVDAEASAGWMPLDVRRLGAHLLSFSPHRFYGPKGVGVLYRHRRARIESLIHGGVQEGGRRAGIENVAVIVGAGVASEMAGREIPGRVEHTAEIQRLLWDGLKKHVPHWRLNGPEPGAGRITTNLNISLEFVEGEGVALMCDLQGVALASGAACVSKAMKVPPTLMAIGLDHVLALGNVLLSVGQETTRDDVEAAVEIIARVVAKLRGMSPLWEDFQRGRIPARTAQGA